MSAQVMLPASKSISNRMLLLRALCSKEFEIENIAVCDDTNAVRAALAAHGGVINIGAAGTAMRFLTAYFASRVGVDVVLDGSPRMRQRPMGILVDALRQLGASIDYCGENGYPPLHIKGRELHGGAISLPGNVSSQYITALMLIAPVIGGMDIDLTGDVISRPYIEMTMKLMREYGITAEMKGNHIEIEQGEYFSHDYVVESDWSAASYWYAIQSLLPQSQIVLEGLRSDSLQGDRRIAKIADEMGIKTNFTPQGVELCAGNWVGCACSSYFDMSDTPDIAQTLAVALCLLNRPFRLTGLRTLRIKETDRLEALRSQLLKLGYAVKVEGDDALSWHFERVATESSPRIATFNDHRMAMAFAPAACRFPGLVIEDVNVVEKSYPEFWSHLEAAGFKIEEVK